MILKDRGAIVTGGSQGIGAAIAIRMAAEGAKVAIVNNSHPARTAAVVPEMKARRHGKIINVSSIAGFGGFPNSSAIAPRKAASIC